MNQVSFRSPLNRFSGILRVLLGAFVLAGIVSLSFPPKLRGIGASAQEGVGSEPGGWPELVPDLLSYSGAFFISPVQYGDALVQASPGMRPLAVRAIAAGSNIDDYDALVQDLAEISEPGVEKYIGFSSFRPLEEKLSQPGPPGFATHADYLHSIGVRGFTYNTQATVLGNPWTPADEMAALFSTDPLINPVAQFASLASQYGFERAIWVPYREGADGFSPAGELEPDYQQALQLMYQAGLSGVALQEQDELDQSCAEERADAFAATLNLHTASNEGAKPLMMVHFYLATCIAGEIYAESQCGLQPQIIYRWSHCDEFIDRISEDLAMLSLPDRPSGAWMDLSLSLRSSDPLQSRIGLPLTIKD